MNEFCKWALGILFALIVGAYGFTNNVSNSMDTQITRSEDRVMERLKTLEDKLDRLIERRP